jgi:hypothetical protein
VLHLERIEGPFGMLVCDELQGHATPIGEGAQETQRLLEKMPHVVPRPLRMPAPGKIQELSDDGSHLARLVEHDGRVVVCRTTGGMGVENELGAAGHDRKGRPELVADSRGQLAESGQTIGMAKLLERLDALRRLALRLHARRRELMPHRVHLVRELAQLVALREDDVSGELTGTDSPSFPYQHSYRLPYQKDSESDRKHSRDSATAPTGAPQVIPLGPTDLRAKPFRSSTAPSVRSFDADKM